MDSDRRIRRISHVHGSLKTMASLGVGRHAADMQNMKTISHWIPAAFCAFLSLLALSMQIGPDSGVWKPTFYCFLPMCFFFVGMTTSAMYREIRELRGQVAELQQRRVD